MTEELQNLLDRIQKEGVEKADAKAEKIIEDARRKAEAIVKDAEQNAAALREQAEADAASFEARAEQSLQQSARDLILTIAETLNKVLAGIVSAAVDEALSEDVLKTMLATVVDAYCKQAAGSANIEILVGPDEKKAIVKFFTAKYANAMKAGLTVEGDDTLAAGFRVSMKDKKIQHDFSSEAIAAALCQLLRPRLAEIVKKAQAGDKS